VVPDNDDPTISRYAITAGGTNERYPRVAANPADADYRFLVVWEQRDDSGDPIYGRFAAETGGTTGNAFQIMTDAVVPAVAYEGSLARYLVTARRGIGWSLRHYGQLLDADGTADGSAFEISHVSADERPAAIAALDGRFRVLWRSGDRILGRDVASASARSDGYTVFGNYPGRNAGIYPALACRDTLHCLAARWVSGDDIYVGLVFH
jgi:hypothetical protein